MIHWLEHHGIEGLFAYYVLISALGTMPPLPDNATYLQKWAFSAAHAFCGNLRSLVSTIQQQQSKDKETL